MAQQQDQCALNRKIIESSFDHTQQTSSLRKLPKFKKRKILFNPLNYLGAGFLFVYQNVFSEQIQASCVYQTSCSEYTKLSVARYGIFIGTLRGFNQLSECDVRAKYEHEDVFITSDGKIIKPLEEDSK